MHTRKPCVVSLHTAHGPFTRILGGPPQTVSMKSGLVSLEPGNSVGAHSTGDCEEVLLILEGEGEAHVAGHPPLALSAGNAVYIPPDHEHDIHNHGDTRLRYVYVVARAHMSSAD
jgi:mannose-6-phosphate isomerase-like protein (cupin superfamily)